MAKSKRPYFLIYETQDYDGYYTYVRAITSNYKLARSYWEDFHFEVINNFFEGYDDDDYEDNWRPLPEKCPDRMNLSTWGDPNLWSVSINDDCEKWITLHILKIYPEK